MTPVVFAQLVCLLCRYLQLLCLVVFLMDVETHFMASVFSTKTRMLVTMVLALVSLHFLLASFSLHWIHSLTVLAMQKQEKRL